MNILTIHGHRVEEGSEAHRRIAAAVAILKAGCVEWRVNRIIEDAKLCRGYCKEKGR